MYLDIQPKITKYILTIFGESYMHTGKQLHANWESYMHAGKQLHLM